MRTYVIDKITKNNLAILDFAPRKDDRFAININGKNCECIVNCVLYELHEKATLVFVTIHEPYYSEMIKDIKWNLNNANPLDLYL